MSTMVVILPLPDTWFVGSASSDLSTSHAFAPCQRSNSMADCREAVCRVIANFYLSVIWKHALFQLILFFSQTLHIIIIILLLSSHPPVIIPVVVVIIIKRWVCAPWPWRLMLASQIGDLTCYVGIHKKSLLARVWVACTECGKNACMRWRC